MDKVTMDCVAGYLTLFSKSNFGYQNCMGEHCTAEYRPKQLESGEVRGAEGSLVLLKDNITTMKKHIEMAEKFLEDIAE